MRVCKHGCDIKNMFCFSHANRKSTNLKKKSFWVEKFSDNFTLFTHSLVGWNLDSLYKHAVLSIFVYLSCHFKQEKYIFWKASFFCKTRTDKTCKTLCTRLHDWYKNFSFNQYHNRVLHFFKGKFKFVNLSNRKLFPWYICI